MTKPNPDKPEELRASRAELLRRLPKGYAPTNTEVFYLGSWPLLRRTERRDEERTRRRDQEIRDELGF